MGVDEILYSGVIDQKKIETRSSVVLNHGDQLFVTSTGYHSSNYGTTDFSRTAVAAYN